MIPYDLETPWKETCTTVFYNTNSKSKCIDIGGDVISISTDSITGSKHRRLSLYKCFIDNKSEITFIACTCIFANMQILKKYYKPVMFICPAFRKIVLFSF